MAAEFLRHQSSRAYYENHRSGCMWGLLHFLDLDRHRHRRKMLTYRRRHGDEKSGGGIKILTSDQNVISTEQEHSLDKEASNQMENKTYAGKKSSGSAHLITLLYKKLIKKTNRKLKNSPSAAQLLRTMSIHHLECNDYVLPDEMILDSDSLTIELNSHEMDLSASSEQACGTQNTVLGPGAKELGQNIPVLSRDKNSPSILKATEESLQDTGNGETVLNHSTDFKQKIKDVIKEEHRIYMDGVLDKIPFGCQLPDDVETEKENPGGDSLRSKFGSDGFVDAKSKFACRSIQRSRSLTESLDRYSHLLEFSSVREPKRLPQWSNSVKEQDNNLADRRILRSHSLSESLDRYSHLLDIISVKEPQRSSQRLNSAHGRVLRSHSLSESRDRYHLLESISVREPPWLPQRLNSIKEQDNNTARRKVLRSRSLSESFDKYSQLLEYLSVREPKRQPERLKSIWEEAGLQDMKSQMACGRIPSNPEVESFSFSNNIPSEVPALSSKRADSGLSASDEKADANTSAEPNLVDILVSAEESMEADIYAQNNGESNSSVTMGGLEQLELRNEHDSTEACIVSDGLIGNDSCSIPQHEHENKTEDDPSDKPLKPSPVSVLDSCFEDTQSQAGMELQSSWMHFEEQDSGVNPENRFVDAEPETMEVIKADCDKGQMAIDTGDTNSYHIKEEAEFNYVKDVLKKSGFNRGTEEFLAAWYSSYEPVDQLLSVEDGETMRDDSSLIPLNHQLLLDLINEVLVEIYEGTVACSTGLSHFYPRIRPAPVGDHLLEEVWAKVSCYLSLQQDMNHAIEHIEAQDYAKNDGWMNLHWDVERVGIYLEGLILDNLIDEIIANFGDV